MYSFYSLNKFCFVSVTSDSVIPLAAAHQASLPWLSPGACSNSCSLSWWCHPAISSSIVPFSHCPQSFPASGSFPMSRLFAYQLVKVLALQHQSFQWILRVDLLCNRLVCSPCCPRESQESSPEPQFKSISSSALSLLYGPTLTSVHDYWKDYSFDNTDLCQQTDVSA